VTRKGASAEDARRVADEVRRRAPHARLAPVHLAPVGWAGLDGTSTEAPTGDVLAVTAIADPSSFTQMVEHATGARSELLAFADHHDYTAHDVERIRRVADGRPIVTTEKDAVKLEAHQAMHADARVLVLGVEVEAGEAALRAALLETAGERIP
jgi:tetraacyldisaccharide-1-P 4'-kinase